MNNAFTHKHHMKRNTRTRSIFLAHSSKDHAFVERLSKDLRKYNIRVWVDEAEILVGDSLFRKIEQGIREVDYVGIILSPTSVKSEWVTKELEIALNEEINGRKVKVLPILYKKCDIPTFLRGKKWASFCVPSTYKIGLKELTMRLLLSEPSSNPERWSTDYSFSKKALGFGLECGLLKTVDGRAEYDDAFIAVFYRGCRIFYEDHKDNIEGWLSFSVLLAFGLVSKRRSKKEVPLYKDELTSIKILGDNLLVHLLRRGIEVQVFRSRGKRVSKHEVFVTRVFDAIVLGYQAIKKRNVYRWVLRKHIDIVRLHLGLTMPRDIDLCYPLGLLTFSMLESEGYIKELEQILEGRWPQKPWNKKNKN